MNQTFKRALGNDGGSGIARLNPVLLIIGTDDTAGLVLREVLASMQCDILLVR